MCLHGGLHQQRRKPFDGVRWSPLLKQMPPREHRMQQEGATPWRETWGRSPELCTQVSEASRPQDRDGYEAGPAVGFASTKPESQGRSHTSCEEQSCNIKLNSPRAGATNPGTRVCFAADSQIEREPHPRTVLGHGPREHRGCSGHDARLGKLLPSWCL